MGLGEKYAELKFLTSFEAALLFLSFSLTTCIYIQLQNVGISVTFWIIKFKFFLKLIPTTTTMAQTLQIMVRMKFQIYYPKIKCLSFTKSQCKAHKIVRSIDVVNEIISKK